MLLVASVKISIFMLLTTSDTMLFVNHISGGIYTQSNEMYWFGSSYLTSIFVWKHRSTKHTTINDHSECIWGG